MKEIENNVFYTGSCDRNRRIFDELIPLPQGTTYNSFLIKGSNKTALIDTVYGKKSQELIEKLKRNNIEIDYIISNHAEQDHTGAIPSLLEVFDNAIVVTNEKVAQNINSMLKVPFEKIQIINDSDTLELGGKTLKFIFAPFVHWPDTMFCHLIEDNILFTTDYLGAHYTSSFEDVFADYSTELLQRAKGYYSEIIMPFATFARKYLKIVKEISPKIIAPSHGPIYDKPQFILDAYENWTNPIPKPFVVIPYVSMYDSTKYMLDYLYDRLSKEPNLTVKMFDLVNDDIGELAIALVDASTVVLGASMVLFGPHPQAVYASYLINILKPKMKYFSIIGSFGWGGKLVETIDGLITNIKPENLGNIIVKGQAREDDFKKLDQLAISIIQKNKALY